MAHVSSRAYRPVLLAATATVALALLGSAPARALDDGQETVLGSVIGLGKTLLGFGDDEDAKPRIDYRERAPIVVPPKMQLREPMAPVAQRNSAWPLDQDVANQRSAAAAAARPRGNFVDDETFTARDAVRTGRIAPSRQQRVPEEAGCTKDGDRLCNVYEYWNTTAKIRGPADTSKDIVAGVEPKRGYLTDPPTGYRKPTRSVKATFEPRDRSYEENLGNQAAQVREEARRRNQ
jgi:hypothetical protein